jgi:hypothetical protein
LDQVLDGGAAVFMSQVIDRLLAVFTEIWARRVHDASRHVSSGKRAVSCTNDVRNTADVAAEPQLDASCT